MEFYASKTFVYTAVRIAQLESQVRNTKQQALNMNEEISDKMSRYKRHARDRTEKDLFECQERVAELTRELELSKAEVSEMLPGQDNCDHN